MSASVSGAGVGSALSLPGGKLLLHVIEGSGFRFRRASPSSTSRPARASEPAATATRRRYGYRPAPPLLPGAGLGRRRFAAVKATGKAREKPVLRFKLSETAQLKVYVVRDEHTVVSFAGLGKKGPNKLKLSEALRRGSYSIELIATHEGLTSIVTSPLLIR